MAVIPSPSIAGSAVGPRLRRRRCFSVCAKRPRASMRPKFGLRMAQWQGVHGASSTGQGRALLLPRRMTAWGRRTITRSKGWDSASQPHAAAEGVLGISSMSKRRQCGLLASRGFDVAKSLLDDRAAFSISEPRSAAGGSVRQFCRCCTQQQRSSRDPAARPEISP